MGTQIYERVRQESGAGAPCLRNERRPGKSYAAKYQAVQVGVGQIGAVRPAERLGRDQGVADPELLRM